MERGAVRVHVGFGRFSGIVKGAHGAQVDPTIGSWTEHLESVESGGAVRAMPRNPVGS